MFVLETKNLLKSYKNGESNCDVISNVNFGVEESDFIAIIGRSGSGKSTLLHMLGGLEKPTSGEVLLNGKNIYKTNKDELTLIRRRNIGFVFQKFNLVPILNVYENIILPVNIDKGQLDEVFLNKVVKVLGISDKMDRYPSNLSGGEQQRVAIARALISKPNVILADEPTGNLDKKTGYEVMHLLKEANELFHQTIVMITHDEELAKLTKHIVRLDDGKIVGGEINE